MRVVVGALVCAMLAGQAGAATFYYVGGLYTFDNQPWAEGPLRQFTTGVLEVNESEFPEGVAGQSFTFEYDWNSENDQLFPKGISLRLASGLGINTEVGSAGYAYHGSSMSFGEDGKPQDWSFHTMFEEGVSFEGNGGIGSDWNTFNMGEMPWEDFADEFLTDLGYKKGTKKFNELRDTHNWSGGYGYGEGGRWYDDALDFAAAIARQTMASLPNFPSNIFSIPDCRVADTALTADDFAPPIPA